MKRTKVLLSAVMFVTFVLIASAFVVSRDDDPAAVAHEEPAQVEAIEGSELSRVTLTQRAVERLGIEVGEVAEQSGSGSGGLAVPYSAIIYDTEGNTWVYTNPEGSVYVREPVAVERMDGDTAIVSEGPDVGTKVVTVGGAMLYGTEIGVGH